jgi:hypothetical protein
VLAPGGLSTLLGFGGSGGAQSIAGSIVISNNVAAHGFYGIAADNVSPNGACVLKKLLDANGAFEIKGNALTVESQSASVTAGDVCATDYLYPTGNVFPATGAAAVDASNGYRVKAPYQNIGTDGRDPGPNVDLVNAATAHAQDGLPNPFSLFRLGGAARTRSSATLYFTASSSNACAVDISLTNTYATGAGTVSQTREGRSGRADVTGLSAGTRYYYRVTCDTWRLESTFETAP